MQLDHEVFLERMRSAGKFVRTKNQGSRSCPDFFDVV
jgi:hypothetical protein